MKTLETCFFRGVETPISECKQQLLNKSQGERKNNSPLLAINFQFNSATKDFVRSPLQSERISEKESSSYKASAKFVVNNKQDGT